MLHIYIYIYDISNLRVNVWWLNEVTIEARKTLYFLICSSMCFEKHGVTKNDSQERVMHSVLLSCTCTSMHNILLYCYLLHFLKQWYYLNYLKFVPTNRSQCSIADIATRLRTGRSGVRILVKTRSFSSSKRPDRPWGPSGLIFGEYRSSFLGLEWPWSWN